MPLAPTPHALVRPLTAPDDYSLKGFDVYGRLPSYALPADEP